MKIYSFLFFVPAFLLLGAGCTEEEADETYDAVTDILEETTTQGTKGSCNNIDYGSQCLDYVGSYWTEEYMKLNCGMGTFSLDACPYTTVGGCQFGSGTMMETIMWSYDYGGDPVIESAPYAQGACNSITGGAWVLPDNY
jgi:hypothetical protein